MRRLDDYDPGRAIWQAHIDAWMDGELSKRAYRAQNGLSPSTFLRWRNWLKDEARIRERRAVQRRWRRGNAEENPLPPPPRAYQRKEESMPPSRGRIALQSLLNQFRITLHVRHGAVATPVDLHPKTLFQ